MNIKCKLGFHDWSTDCEKCNQCGKTQEDQHDWTKDCEKCSKCGKIRNIEHDWTFDCQECKICEKTRDIEHIWNNGKCEKCEKTTTDNIIENSNESSHHEVYKYLKSLWDGGIRDLDFENCNLNSDMEFNTVNLAFLIIYVAKEKKISNEKVISFLSSNAELFENLPMALLLTRITKMYSAMDDLDQIVKKKSDNSKQLDSAFKEHHIFSFINNGVIGNGAEIFPIPSSFDTVKNIILKVDELINRMSCEKS